MNTMTKSTTTKIENTSQSEGLNWKLIISSYVPVIILLFIFLVGVKSFSSSFKLMGGDFAKSLLSGTANPFLSLMSGMLATVLVQSSSATTAIIVGLVSSGTLGIPAAVPMIMGANLGTSVTNTLVSLGYVSSNKSFARAFASGTIHDFFNFLSVIVLLPIELATGVLSTWATTLANMLYGTSENVKFSSPIKAAIKPFAKGLKAFVTDVLGMEGSSAGLMLALISAVLIIASLAFIVKVTKKIVESSRAEILDRIFSKSAFGTIIFGTIFTFAVQSSSITTSLMVPLAASGMLSLESIFPVTVGANIGTTTTALLASLTGNVHGLTIAIVHFLFNIIGMLIWFVPPFTRRVPILLTETLAKLVLKKRRYGFIYVTTVFFLLPLGCSFFFN